MKTRSNREQKSTRLRFTVSSLWFSVSGLRLNQKRETRNCIGMQSGECRLHSEELEQTEKHKTFY